MGRGLFFYLLCVPLSVQAVTFEAVDTKPSFLVWQYIWTISRLSLSTRSLGQDQGNIVENANSVNWT